MTEVDFGQVQHPHPVVQDFAWQTLGIGVDVRNPPLGVPLRGEALRAAIELQRTGHRTSDPKVRLWGAPPAVDPRTGLHYPAAIISCPYPEQDGTRAAPGPASAAALTAAGAVVNISVGTREGGEVSRRVAVAGGRAIIGQFGRFPNVNVSTEQVNNAASPVVFSWIQESSSGSGGSAELWEAPPFGYAGGDAPIIVPEGAVEVLSDTDTTLTFSVLTSGTARTFAVSVAAGAAAAIPSTASSFAGPDACVLLFRLSPV